MQAKLRAKNVTVTRDSVNVGQVSDFSSLVAKIPANTQVVYIPWQIAAKAQLFGQQLREQGKQATLFGSDGSSIHPRSSSPARTCRSSRSRGRRP